jgi:UDP-GlcNAc:undecaprenyl-phosphate/decaprenyl-phosphate GlcNAc-1-phosphate transferase
MVNNTMFFEFFNSLFLSSIFGICIISSKKYLVNKHFEEAYQPQKIHFVDTPRIGGVCIFFGLTCLIFFKNENSYKEMLFYILVSAPCFFAGLLEDIIRNVRPIIRLLSSILSGVLFVVLMDYRISSVDIYFFDIILSYSFISMLITILAVATYSQAINIIDGLNGLALGVCLTIFTSLFILSYMYEDHLLNFYCLIFIGLILGLFIFNFPFGKIFLGDGGAYFLGVASAVTSIMLFERNSQISPLCILLLLFYPIYEITRSLLRRIIFKTGSVFKPDNLHFHSHLYKYFTKNKKKDLSHNWQSSSIILLLNCFFSTWALLYCSEKNMLIYGILLYLLVVEISINKVNYKR